MLGQIFRGVGLAAALLASCVARAEEFPTQNVRIVVSLGAGSAIDVLARQMARWFEEEWRRPVVVENRPGAGGLLAAEYVAKQAPDGHTLLLTGPSVVTGGLQTARAAFDPQRDLAPVAKLATLRIVLATNVDVPARTLPELVAYSRAHPGKLNYAGTGRTSIIDTGLEVLKRGLGLDATPVTYPGAAQHITALLRNDVQLVWGGVAILREQLSTGRVRLLAAVSKERLADLPDVPSIVEYGYAGFIPTIWSGLLAPARTAPAVIERINADANRILARPEAVRVLGEILGMDPAALPADRFRAEMQAEGHFWADMFKTLGIEAR